MAQVRIKNLTQHRIYVPVPVGIMMRPAQEVILSEVSDDLLAQSKKISRLVEKRVIQVWIQPQDPDIDDTLETRFINVGGGLPLHGSTHYDGGSDPIDIDQLRTSGGIPGYLMEAGAGGSISWVPHTVPPHAANHAHGGTDELDISTLGSTTAPAAGYLAASDGANGLSWVSPTAPGAHKATHYEGGSDSIDVADLSSASATGPEQLVRSNGTGGLEWTSAGTPGAIQPDDTAAEGSASTYARSDHRHAIVADTPGTIQPDDAAAEGSSTAFARADHQHAITADTPIAVTPGDPAAEGASTAFARADHQHSVAAFAAPGTIQPDDTADAGTASSFARSDHRHAIVADTPGTIQPDDAAAEGTATSFARSDHTHAITAAAPAQGIGGGNQEGTATSFSRSDHDHTTRETGGPTDLTTGAIPDGYSVRRSGTALVGVNMFDPARVVTLATNIIGADATSVANAITIASALTPTAANPVTILVAPGTYSTPPFTLPSYVNICSIGGSGTAIISATTTTSALMSAPGKSTVCGVTLKGANGVGGIGVSITGTGGVILEDCLVDDCETGVSVAGAGYRVQFLHSTISNATDGLYVNNATSVVQVTNLTCALCTNGVHIGSSGGIVTGSQYRASDDSSFLRHVWVEGTTAATVFTVASSFYREDKAFYHPDASIFVEHASNILGDAAVQFTTEVHVGDEYRPRESCFGGGDSHTRGMAALTNTNLEVGTWNNITTQIKDEDATSASLFAGVAVANCFYIGGDVQFPGLKPTVTTARSGGALVLEYWNGTAWTQIPHVNCDANAPYGQYAQDAFSRVQNDQIRFGTAAITGWATKSLNGITKYWVRYRVTTALTTSPAADRVKLHTNRTEINGDGIIEHFGAAEPVRQLLWHRSLMEELVGFAQPDSQIDIATGLSIKALNNRWQNGNKDGSTTLLQALPGLDTSRPLVYVVGWAPEATGTGNVELQLDIATVNPGDVLDGTLPYTAQLSQIVTGPFTAYTLQTTQFSFTVPDLTTTGSLAMALYRDAGGGNLDDTFGSDAMHVYSAVYGTFWR
jgi:hypothetical protein